MHVETRHSYQMVATDRSFVVQRAPDCEQSASQDIAAHQPADAAGLLAVEDDGCDQSRIFLAKEHPSSHKSWKTLYDRLPLRDSLTVDQTPPWLGTTGISRWIASLNLEKQDLRACVPSTPCSESFRSSISLTGSGRLTR